MSLYNFGKPIYLPSGGLSYPPLAWLHPITKEVMFLENDPTSKDSRLEFALILINKYCKLPVDILDLYIDDMFFIWMNMLSIDLQRSTEITEIDKCSECGNMNVLLVDFADLRYNMINPNNNHLKESVEIIVNDISIKTHHRRVRDSMIFATMNLYNSFDSYVESCVYYICPQVDELSFNNEIIHKNDYVDFLLNQHMYEIFSIYHKMMKLDGVFGVNKKIQYKCKKCGASNKAGIFSDLSFSNINSADTKSIYKDQRNLVKYIMNYSSMHSMPTREFIDFPIRFDESLVDVLNNSKLRNGNVFVTYSDSIG